MGQLDWFAPFEVLVRQAAAGETAFPVEYYPGRDLTSAEVGRVAEALAAIDPRIAVEYEKRCGDSEAPPRLVARLVEFDPNPPAFLELHPLPIGRA